MFNKQTTLDLDGPKLGFSTDPQNLTINAGTAATFVAIGTATFPSNIPAKFATNTGIVTYRWYVDDIAVTDGQSYAGSGTTTLQIFNNTSAKTVYCEADYIPSAYGLPGVAVTVGSARSTGHAIFEPVRSGSAILSLNPQLAIDTQPTDLTVAEGNDAVFTVEASLDDNTTEGFSYQWQINGSDVTDGTTTFDAAKSESVTVTIRDQSGVTETVNFADLSTKTLGTGTYDLTTDGDFESSLELLGAGGGLDDYRGGPGGKGGKSTGTFTFLSGTTYKIVVGSKGVDGANGGAGGTYGGGGNGAGSNAGSGGGGYTGLFVGTVSLDNAVIIAGGGGGGSNDPASGGGGGGATGGDASNQSPGRGGAGGTQSAGGAGGPSSNAGTDGSALAGGPGAAGGGGGYYGGGGGRTTTTAGANGAGGGGSGYIGSSLLTDGVTTQSEGAEGSQDGSFIITATDTSIGTATLTISGSTSNSLTVSSNQNFQGTVKVTVSNSNAYNSPLTSNTVSLSIVDARNLIKIEQYDFSSTATLSEVNLTDGGLSLSDATHPANEICIYSPEKDIPIEMDLYGGRGLTFDEGTNANNQWEDGDYSGGEGGYSKIKFTLEQNVEYIITGLYDTVNAPFVYRKANLIACVGEGGDGGHYGDGGDGGGVNESGNDGEGRFNGVGGNRVATGNLGDSGEFGTQYTDVENVYAEDSIASIPRYEGGQTVKCSKGIYYRQEGFTSCQDVGDVKYRISNGTEVTNSAQIERGFKAGYNIMTTGGSRAASDGGDGGNGATGGFAGTSGGGGGGSGYTDGTATVIRSRIGGSTGPARVNIKLSAGDYFIDDEGRILIYSSTDVRDPRTGITKTTGVVNYGDNACIDDARWQRFLDLARDGTQDYRLTATENNSTTKITNATEKNIHKMMNANQVPLKTSLTDWHDTNYSYLLLVLAWDETSGASISGGDYSLLSWSPESAYGYVFYGGSSNSFFNPTVYTLKNGINLWILPPGVPDF